jgi:hypothetical protein
MTLIHYDIYDQAIAEAAVELTNSLIQAVPTTDEEYDMMAEMDSVQRATYRLESKINKLIDKGYDIHFSFEGVDPFDIVEDFKFLFFQKVREKYWAIAREMSFEKFGDIVPPRPSLVDDIDTYLEKSRVWDEYADLIKVAGNPDHYFNMITDLRRYKVELNPEVIGKIYKQGFDSETGLLAPIQTYELGDEIYWTI